VGIRCGIVGLPNAGKSTLFNAVTGADTAVANYPFTTIEPNVGVAVVPDGRLDEIAAIVGSAEVHPAVVEFVDIAGLVEGASRGEGLGNQFLHHIRETDAIAHVVRCFDDPNVTHVAGVVDPIADLETVDTELAIADLESVERAIAKVERQAKAGDKDAAARLGTLTRVAAALAEGRPIRSLDLAESDAAIVRDLFLLTAKPVMYVANVGEDGLDGNPLVEAVQGYAAREGAEVVVIAADLEAELSRLDDADRVDMLAGYGLAGPGLDTVVDAAYRLLGLRTFFTANEKEARARTVVAGTRAPQAAGGVHTDFERGFIRAEVVTYDDLVAAGSEHAARDVGRWRLEGRDYEVQEGDVIWFRSNV
jgi:GTP-binding protein YchF